ncbi:uncharacterized protein K452DRAFT_315708 [Aplosporella prunicola CBS 121167]|uniref:Uncharacterized protein n=1 Tax=Aplosporella prunicola CBS 121167 TaxID=1176127 RepID=A0A6A6BP52_9PEZI|nr:uncharacterized protein K452DRAFT_315708 [Aplosporella prunicola CBS 121167]KAF2145468.1 hypothetical protein K452DRAFT_315708 [Aplosporella prunicola CBS 121167]
MPRYYGLGGDDEWSMDGEWGGGGIGGGISAGARHVHPPMGRRSGLLEPEHGHFHAAGIHRSRSTGSRPTPHILNIHNNVNPRLTADQQAPTRASATPSPRGRPLDDEWALNDDMEVRIIRERSRGRGLSDAPNFHRHEHRHEHWGSAERDRTPPEYRAQLQLAATSERLRDMEERMRREKEEGLLRLELESKYAREKAEREEEERLMKRRVELQMLKSKAEREEEEDRIRREEERIREKYERKRLEDERARAEEERRQDELRKTAVREEKERAASEAAARKAAAEEFAREQEKKAKKEAEERQRIIDEEEKAKLARMKHKAEERARIIAEVEKQNAEAAAREQAEREALLAKIEKEKAEKAAKEKAAWEEYECKRKEKEAQEKAAKKAEEERLEAEMRKKLVQFGFQENQIQGILDPAKAAELQAGAGPNNPLTVVDHHHHHHQPPHTPTYVKVKREYLSIETLKYYDLPWEYDRNDAEYIIIMREMDPRETDILFEHTRRIKDRSSTRLLIEDRGRSKKPEYAWVRRRRSAHDKSPARPARKIVLGEMFR